MGDLTLDAAKAKAEAVRERLWRDFIPGPDARQELERELAWLERRSAGGT